MKRFPEIRPIARHLFGFVLASMLALPLPSLAAATVALTNQPLTTTTGSNVKPNVMFILDDSGTMEYQYLPDWASSFTSQPALHTNSAVNGVAYNPAVTYTPPVFYDADGALNTTTYPSYNNTGTALWSQVKRDGYGVLWAASTTDNLVGNASYYTFVDKEYCSSIKKTSCIEATAPTTVGGVTYNIPAGLRWCTNAQLNSCQSIKDSTHTFPRYPGRVVQPTARITVTNAGSVTGITVNGQQIMRWAVSSASGTTTALRTFASNIVTAINNCTAAATGNCTIAGYSATRLPNTATVEITAPAAVGAITVAPVVAGTAPRTVTAFAGGMLVPGDNIQTIIVSTDNSYPYLGSGQSNRTDCGGTTCNYQQEMTNYANWWAYYHTRMQAMKSSVSRAFKSLNQKYRVGFSTICDTTATTGTNFLAVDTFETAHKNNWFKKLFATGTDCWTPLRGALAKTGQYYAHKVGAVDPVQYSCQQNFAILSTDGYWNNNVETGTFGPYRLDGANVGDLDNDLGTRLSGMYQGPTATANSLADVAKYYYETDLRHSTLSNCAGAKSPDFPSGNPNVCDPDNVPTGGKDSYGTQHMTTFTMGLGADGVLNFQSDYETATSGDYWDLTHGLGSPVTNWSVPAANGPSAIDDLWHAAVNGRGSYFSAKDPDQIITGFNKALTDISAKTGSAAAAATSTLNPVPGDNLVYLANYTTVKWTGNLEARSVDTTSGLVSDTAVWCVEDVLAANTCPSASIHKISSGGSDAYYCIVTATASTCPSPGSFDPGTNMCTTQIDVGCKGRLLPQVIADKRTIYTAPASGHIPVMFDSNYATSHPASFEAAHVNTLTQWAAISGAGGHTPEKLINYLRGQRTNDMNATLAADRLYRARETVMGDTLESQPAFIAAPVFSYTYPGYAEFKAAHATREGMVYVGSNDGMLHAFYGANNAAAPAPPALCVASGTVHCGGDELWAYVPSMVIPNMWQLADTSYSTKHANFINGSPNIADICTATDCATATASDWRTILVGGLNGGGRGYYALDITDPAQPTLLWEFTTTDGIGSVKDDDLGYSFGRPVITRMADGTWVVVVTSGYNNVNPGSGKGFLFVLNATTGDMIGKISTEEGDATAPSGLAHVAVWNDTRGGNQAGFAYAGDLNGNLWRFNINDGLGTDGVSADKGPGGKMRFATLYSGTGGTQPITTLPELGLVGTNHVIFVGTGKYLEAADLTNKQQQTLYALKDVGAAATLITNPRAKVAPTTAPNMIRQTITLDSSGNTRTGTKNAVDFNTDLGWFVDFPDVQTGSERVNINPKLVLGTLLIPTIVPSATACSPGGYGWLNYFDYASGAPVDGGTGNTNVSMKFDSPIVGFNVIYIEGTPKLMVISADGDISLPKRCANCKAGEGFIDPKNKTPPGFSTHRTSWREMF